MSYSEFMEHFFDIFLNTVKAYSNSNPENCTFDKLYAKICFIFSTITEMKLIKLIFILGLSGTEKSF